VSDGKIGGIADVRDDSSSRTGMRLIIELKRDAVAQVVLNNLYKHTQLQETFGANMLALVDGVPRTLSIEQFVRSWIAHQIEVIQRRTRYRLRKAEERAHILRGYLKALDALDEVIALIRASATVEDARTGLMGLLEIDELQATAILDMQLRRLAALERQKIIDEFDDLMARIADYNDILASEPRQRSIVSEELAEVVNDYGDERRTQFVPWDGDVSHEDLIAEDDVVVTITSGGYAKRTKTDLYRQQRRGGRGVKGAALRQDDVVEHFFVTTTHHWILFFTTRGRVYRAKAYQLPEAGRDAKGQHVANLLAFQPDEEIAQVLTLRDYEAEPYLVLATRGGMVKKTRLSEFDSNRSGGVIAINLREDDEVISAQLVSEADDLLLVSRKGMSARFHADDATLRPMGRATGGVIGMRFREDDALLSMDVVREGSFVVTVTDGGYAKRTPVEEWSPKGRGILGVRAMRLVEARGGLVGAVVCTVDDQIFAVANDGIVIRTRVDEIRPSGRDTMGVRLMNLGEDRSLVAVARAGESEDESDEDDAADSPAGETSGEDSASTGGDSDASASASADATTGQDTSDGLPQV
jgi:DNA gyrase subunit A